MPNQLVKNGQHVSQRLGPTVGFTPTHNTEAVLLPALYPHICSYWIIALIVAE